MDNRIAMNPMMIKAMQMGMNPMMMAMQMGMNPMMMTPEEINYLKRMQGFMMGQLVANQIKKTQQKPVPQQTITTNKTNPNTLGKINITFLRNGSTKTIKTESSKMIAELLYDYCQISHIQSGNFLYKGQTLDPNDCRSLLEIGMVNGDQINVS